MLEYITKKGKKLKKFQGKSSLLKKNKSVEYAKEVKPVADPSTKRYSFHDEWNWFYLPYKTIKGKEYYSLGHGGYIKAVNVDSINDNYLYTNEIKATTIANSPTTKVAPLYDTKNNKIKKTLEIGKKIILDKQSESTDFTEMGDGYDGLTTYYRIKGTNNFIEKSFLKLGSKALLPTFSNFMHVAAKKDTHDYTAQGELFTPDDVEYNQHIKKGTDLVVTAATYVWIKSESKTELLYKLAPTSDFSAIYNQPKGYIKAKDFKYVAGKKLQPLNTFSEINQ
ncbi:hypothetical protein [Lactobacillus sp. ESL0681]|uniref:hypothetical protein n=1 Tax=Lactobacillus sp. ESL0681 TaxID=2983211 RepID=UPI0023FA34CC|nr:hypothetical protein [Lactobacillus sp. ESL0681]WEV40972.1 hypothetical protein OZX59_03370 [Lactobacillus sp. ESL0681]